ncbi:MAG: chemotaxis response regulator protein-glutamate methylesterase [Pseudomonadota bacterium]|nr:chemotaxis response regulator protein-glutamate methylesterase [Pseudomonadota bacterium]
MKIGIVNDLQIAVEALRRVVAMDPAYEVIWTARDGAEAVALCAQKTPDLILMDLIMPGMTGVEATRQIMLGSPCAILIVTANVGANATRVFEAMSHGALDAVDTPIFGAGAPPVSASPLLAKIASLGKRLGNPDGQRSGAGASRALPSRVLANRLVVIGASAGGPAALAKILSALPEDFPAAVVIVQHLDAQFAASMAEWLNSQSRLPVRVAKQGDRPMTGLVLMAGTSDHLALTEGGCLGYVREPSACVYRPSVDVFFQSVCRFWPFEAVGVLLTGMGRDGALGLKALRDKSYFTIAQDQNSSAVYGMPKAAATLNAAVRVLALERIAPTLIEMFTPYEV